MQYTTIKSISHSFSKIQGSYTVVTEKSDPGLTELNDVSDLGCPTSTKYEFSQDITKTSETRTTGAPFLAKATIIITLNKSDTFNLIDFGCIYSDIDDEGGTSRKYNGQILSNDFTRFTNSFAVCFGTTDDYNALGYNDEGNDYKFRTFVPVKANVGAFNKIIIIFNYGFYCSQGEAYNAIFGGSTTCLGYCSYGISRCIGIKLTASDLIPMYGYYGGYKYQFLKHPYTDENNVKSIHSLFVYKSKTIPVLLTTKENGLNSPFHIMIPYENIPYMLLRYNTLITNTDGSIYKSELNSRFSLAAIKIAPPTVTSWDSFNKSSSSTYITTTSSDSTYNYTYKWYSYTYILTVTLNTVQTGGISKADIIISSVSSSYWNASITNASTSEIDGKTTITRSVSITPKSYTDNNQSVTITFAIRDQFKSSGTNITTKAYTLSLDVGDTTKTKRSSGGGGE